MALKGIRVLEFAGLAPAPFCGMILADHGANVIRIDSLRPLLQDKLCRGKQSIAIDLKQKEGVDVVKRLSRNSDILIEPYRPGIMEKLGLGPKDLMPENSRLIYARLTGYGQDGIMSQRGGHDLNYVAMSGMLSRMTQTEDRIVAPINFLADMAGGGMTCTLGILLALHHRNRTGLGQVIDCNMVEGSAYAGSFISQMMGESMVLNTDEGVEGTLDGSAHFYRTYKTLDGRFVAVGALEPKFYSNVLKGLQLTEESAPQFPSSKLLVKKFAAIFATRTLAEWTDEFADLDACVTPVLTLRGGAACPQRIAQIIFYGGCWRDKEPYS